MSCARVLTKLAATTTRSVATKCLQPPFTHQHQVSAARLFSVNSAFLSNRRYSDKHEWVEVAEDKGKVGITDYAQESLGDIVYAQLPQLGDKFSQGDECGALESVKAASELYSPISGTVTAVNPDVEEQPGLVNQHPYTQGWLFEVELSQPEEVDQLMSQQQYDDFCKSIESD